MASLTSLSSNDSRFEAQAQQLLASSIQDEEVDRLDEALSYAAKIQTPSSRSNIITDIAMTMIGRDQFDRANLSLNAHHFRNDPEAYSREKKKIDQALDLILYNGIFEKIRPLVNAFHSNDQIQISQYLKSKALEQAEKNKKDIAIYIAVEIPSEIVQTETLHTISACKKL